MYKKARQAIAKEITSTMEDILENIDVKASKHLEKIIQKTSKKLAKELIKVLQAAKVEDLASVRKQKRIDNFTPRDNAGNDEVPPEHDNADKEKK